MDEEPNRQIETGKSLQSIPEKRSEACNHSSSPYGKLMRI